MLQELEGVGYAWERAKTGAMEDTGGCPMPPPPPPPGSKGMMMTPWSTKLLNSLEMNE